MGKVYGNSTTVSYGTNGTPLATSSTGLGTPHTYGGVGVDMAEPAVKGKVTVPLGNTGKSVEVVAKSAIPRAGIARGLIKLAKFGGGPAGIAAGLAAEALLEYGIKKLEQTPDGRLIGYRDDPNVITSDGNGYRISIGAYDVPGVYGSRTAACAAAVAFGKTIDGRDRTANGCIWKYADDPGGSWQDLYPQKITNPSCPSGWFYSGSTCTQEAPLASLSEQEILDRIATASGWPSSAARALGHMLGEPDIRTDLDPQPAGIVGPMTVPGATSKSSESVKLVPGTNIEAPPGTTKTDPGTKTTTSTKTHPIEYNGSTVKYGTITNNVTNITNNVTNVTTTETTKTEEKQDDNKPDLCEKHPDTIGCQKIEFDTPEGEIPRKQIDVSWSPVDLGLGGGSCPAPVQLYDNKQFSYQLACDNLLLIKTMVIAIALFVGGMIIFGGRADQ
ncbi:virulence factor TspB C-terminal domain-related protein [uncultured Comamonas sp.]|uniref:virulence factor TspB C-terminal domain-related protein n=1 Tax=uncultured Comamonas sp. TaxID=114710 RepID=UPI0025D5FDDE|nr:virulence factor TspB C-terminal domain-related protein [uncultured Comamonas sp.]